MDRAIVLFSGGVDSTALLAYYVKTFGGHVTALSVNYVQRHAVELEAARHIARRFDVEQYEISLEALSPFLGGSALTDPAIDVPLAPYSPDVIDAMTVPARNGLFVMLAASIGLSMPFDKDGDTLYVAIGAHAGDGAVGYADCSSRFCELLSRTMLEIDRRDVILDAPFIKLTKAMIVQRAVTLDAPLELTWSCYQGSAAQCGRCATCRERRKAFIEAGVTDRTAYLE